MRVTYFESFRRAARYTLAGFLAASTMALAQDQGGLPPPTYGTQAPPSSGGWKRVGDAGQAQAPDASGPNQDSNYENLPAPVNSGAQDQMQQPPPPMVNGQSPYGAPNAQGQYGQAPYGQAGYGPYGPQSNPQAPVPAAVPPQLTIASGTFMTVRVNQPLSSDSNQPGDAFTATLAYPLVVNGVVIAEPGQTLAGRVVTVQKHGAGTSARLGIQLTTLTLVDGQQVPITTQFISRHGGTTPGGVEAGSVIATTGLGAAIGAAAGWGTGAAIGAGAGAAAGLIGVLLTHNHASVIYPEQELTFETHAPVTISTQNAPQAFRYVQPNEYQQQASPSGQSGYGPPPNGPGAYVTAGAPPPAYPAYPYPAYPYPYYSYGYGYPYYWGPSFAFYYGPGYWWGGHYYYHGGYYGHPYYGYGGHAVVTPHAYAAGGHVAVAGAAHGGGGHR